MKWVKTNTGSGVKSKAVGSTSIGAFRHQCITRDGFGKAYNEAVPFVWFH
jgi:hypothetical protein